jgi:metal-responsive CopG/Arc/MetJ family transcriptional regulator
MSDEQKPFGVSLNQEELQELTNHATNMEVSRSALARSILQQWLTEQRKPVEQSHG